MSKEEIISVQIGKFSNQVGANVWNLRDEFLHDDSDSEERFLPHTYYHKSSAGYVPRCVALDLREHCGNRFQSPYDDSSDTIDRTTWVGKVARPINTINHGKTKEQQRSPYGWCEILKVFKVYQPCSAFPKQYIFHSLHFTTSHCENCQPGQTVPTWILSVKVLQATGKVIVCPRLTLKEYWTPCDILQKPVTICPPFNSLLTYRADLVDWPALWLRKLLTILDALCVSPYGQSPIRPQPMGAVTQLGGVTQSRVHFRRWICH